MSILDTVYSINNVPIHLSDERWNHIVDRRPHMSSYYQAVLEAVEKPMFILRGKRGKRGRKGRVFVAVVALGRRNYLQVAYREESKTEGYVITATLEGDFDEDLIIWREQDQ